MREENKTGIKCFVLRSDRQSVAGEPEVTPTKINRTVCASKTLTLRTISSDVLC